MAKKNVCGIMSRDYLSGHKDINGCLKPHAHNDAHVFRDQNGKLVKWEDDYNCTCGCWDEYDKGDPDVCIIYCEVKNIND